MIAATFIGDIEFEIIQPIHGVNPYSKFLEERGPGIHHIKESVLENIGDVDRLDLEKLRFENDHNAQVAFDAVRYIQDELNDEIFTGVGLMGPFTTAANLAGTEKNLKSYAQRQRESS